MNIFLATDARNDVIERRGFLTGLVSSLAAPALIGPGLVRCGNIFRGPRFMTLCYQIIQSPDDDLGVIKRIPLWSMDELGRVVHLGNPDTSGPLITQWRNIR